MTRCIEVNTISAFRLTKYIEESCNKLQLTKQNIISINTAYDTDTGKFHAFITYED